MSETTVTFVCKVIAQPGREGQLAEALAALIVPTRKEQGCLQYFAHASLERPAEFVLYESWANEPAFEAHTKSPHFSDLVQRMPELLAGPPTREMLRPLG